MIIRFAKLLVATSLLMAALIIPFLLFGQQIEQASQEFFASERAELYYILYGGGLLAADPVLPVPSSVVATFLAAKVGFWKAALTNSIALSFACVFGFYIGRSGERTWRYLGREIPSYFVEWVERYGLIAVLLCRPLPVLAEASLIIAGAGRARPVRLFLACAVAQTALGFAYAFAGSGWGSSETNSLAIFAGAVLLPLGMGILVAIVVLVQRRWSIVEPRTSDSPN